MSIAVLQNLSYHSPYGRKTVVMTTSSAKYVHLTKNLFESMKVQGRDKLLVLCGDVQSGKELQGTGMYTVAASNSKTAYSVEQLARRQPLYVKALLAQGFHVLWTDSDLVWLKDPLHLLFHKSGALLAQDDTNTDQLGSIMKQSVTTPMYLREPSSGFLMVRASTSGEELMELWITKLQEDPEKQHRQALLEVFSTESLRCSEELQNCRPKARFRLLSRANFPSVAHFDRTKAVIYHAGWHAGAARKECHLSRQHLWFSSAGPVSENCDEGPDLSESADPFVLMHKMVRWSTSRVLMDGWGTMEERNPFWCSAGGIPP